MEELLASLLPLLLATKVWQAHTYVYSFVGALLLSTFLVFLVLWRHGRLDMDEGPKFQVFGTYKGKHSRGKKDV